MKSKNTKRTSFKDFIGLYLRGMAMGAADLVPGVSGGTIALITGIYDELLSSISAIHPRMILQVFKGEWKTIWNTINGNFLVVLALGIGTSILGLSNLLHHLLEQHSTLLYCFFFGLVSASIPFVGREIKIPNARAAFAFAVGAAIAFGISSLPISQTEPSALYLFGAGAVAACAMILPGISGSFILLLLGAYATAIGAVKSFDLVRIAIIGCGVISGLLLFSKLLKWTLHRHYNVLLALLTGFLFGSLRAIWPWKEKVELLYTHSDGRETWSEALAWPTGLTAETLGLALACTILGAALVALMNRFSQPIQND
jgi:putative membrane protein